MKEEKREEREREKRREEKRSKKRRKKNSTCTIQNDELVSCVQINSAPLNKHNLNTT